MLLKFIAKRTPKLRYQLVKVRHYTTAKAESEPTQIEQLRTDVTTLQISMAQVQKQLQELSHVLSHSHTKYDQQGNTSHIWLIVMVVFWIISYDNDTYGDNKK